MESSRRVFEGRLINVDILSSEGRAWEVARMGDVAAVLALDDADSVLMVSQDRPAVGGMMWEIPAGRVDAGEDPRECAIRELAEETGYRAASMCHLGTFYSSPGFTDERIFLYLARELQPLEVRPPMDPGEDIRAKWIPRDALRRVGDAKSVAAVALLPPEGPSGEN